MFSSSIIRPPRWLVFPSFFYRLLNRSIPKNFDKKTFDHLSSRRLERFHGNREQLSTHIRANLQSVLKTVSVVNHLTILNSKTPTKHFAQTISIEQLADILFFAYEQNLKLDLFTKRLLECVSPLGKPLSSNSYLELVNLLVLHQQKHYDHQTKTANQILKKFLHHLESNLTEEQIQNLSASELSLLSSAMYRLQLPLQNPSLLESIAEYLIADEKKKSLNAVDKQNLLKILTLSNYGRTDVAEALANRFNQSFEEHLQSTLTSFSYEIVRMTMRIGIYFSLFRFYSPRFFENCVKLIELESKATKPSYRAKDMIQIMNTLIHMGYVRQINSKYRDLIDLYDRMNEFDQNPDRLVDALAPLASIANFPDELLKKLFTNENLRRLTESRMKEKLFFISQSYQLFHSPTRPLLDQNYLASLPHHLFGSWEIEKRKRPNFPLIIQRLLQCVPNRLYVKSAFLLKHYKSPDIIIALNAEQQPQIVPNEMKKKGIGFFQEDQYSMYALEVLSEDELSINEPHRPLGLVYSKARQLQKMSYKPVLIYPNDNLQSLKTTKEVFEWILHRAQSTESLLNKT